MAAGGGMAAKQGSRRNGRAGLNRPSRPRKGDIAWLINTHRGARRAKGGRRLYDGATRRIFLGGKNSEAPQLNGGGRKLPR